MGPKLLFGHILDTYLSEMCPNVYPILEPFNAHGMYFRQQKSKILNRGYLLLSYLLCIRPEFVICHYFGYMQVPKISMNTGFTKFWPNSQIRTRLVCPPTHLGLGLQSIPKGTYYKRKDVYLVFSTNPVNCANPYLPLSYDLCKYYGIQTLTCII